MTKREIQIILFTTNAYDEISDECGLDPARALFGALVDLHGVQPDPAIREEMAAVLADAIQYLNKKGGVGLPN